MVELKKISYANWANCLELSNGIVRLVISTDMGPRVLFYGFAGGQNFFHNFAEDAGKTGGEVWRNYGGHRLWYAPETAARTYYPDNEPVPYRFEQHKLWLDCPDETSRGIGKKIVIELDDHSTRVRIDHTLKNIGLWPIETAIWCLSVMAEGGALKVPQPDFVPHGGGPGQTFQPARKLILWPFTRMNDPRFTWGEQFIEMRQDNRYPAKLKFGVLNEHGRVFYELNGETFCKEYPCIANANYPDMGCNSEFYTEPGFLEVESLSPMLRLAEGESATHTEFWTLSR